jgi:hypothetical protein
VVTYALFGVTCLVGLQVSSCCMWICGFYFLGLQYLKYSNLFFFNWDFLCLYNCGLMF